MRKHKVQITLRNFYTIKRVLNTEELTHFQQPHLHALK